MVDSLGHQCGRSVAAEGARVLEQGVVAFDGRVGEVAQGNGVRFQVCGARSLAELERQSDGAERGDYFVVEVRSRAAEATG